MIWKNKAVYMAFWVWKLDKAPPFSLKGQERNVPSARTVSHSRTYTYTIVVVTVCVKLARVQNRWLNLCLTLNIAMNQKKYNRIKTKQKRRLELDLKWETELDYHMRYYRWKHFCTVSIFLDFWSNWKKKRTSYTFTNKTVTNNVHKNNK